MVKTKVSRVGKGFFKDTKRQLYELNKAKGMMKMKVISPKNMGDWDIIVL